jgi:hypothetical protein
MPKLFRNAQFMAIQDKAGNWTYNVSAMVGSDEDPEFCKNVILAYTVDPKRPLEDILNEIVATTKTVENAT